ncbi:MAG: hypothetical protein E7011_02235 [Alphaproteobacteria bacterium]|nr:hypothetical protein [Alphaproteobacteria bacterium]
MVIVARELVADRAARPADAFTAPERDVPVIPPARGAGVFLVAVRAMVVVVLRSFVAVRDVVLDGGVAVRAIVVRATVRGINGRVTVLLLLLAVRATVCLDWGPRTGEFSSRTAALDIPMPNIRVRIK